MVAAVVQYISANVYIPALRILLRANRSSPVFFSLRVSRARAIQFFLSRLCRWGKYFFRATFSGVVVRCPRPLFAPLCGEFDAREKKTYLSAVETVERTDTSRDLAEFVAQRRFRVSRTTAENAQKKDKKRKKEMKTLNLPRR